MPTVEADLQLKEKLRLRRTPATYGGGSAIATMLAQQRVAVAVTARRIEPLCELAYRYCVVVVM